MEDFQAEEAAAAELAAISDQLSAGQYSDIDHAIAQAAGQLSPFPSGPPDEAPWGENGGLDPVVRCRAVFHGYEGPLEGILSEPKKGADFRAIFPGVQEEELRQLLEDLQAEEAAAAELAAVSDQLSAGQYSDVDRAIAQAAGKLSAFPSGSPDEAPWGENGELDPVVRCRAVFHGHEGPLEGILSEPKKGADFRAIFPGVQEEELRQMLEDLQAEEAAAAELAAISDQLSPGQYSDVDHAIAQAAGQLSPFPSGPPDEAPWGENGELDPVVRCRAVFHGHEGPLEGILSEPRKGAELRAIFPGVQDEELRQMLQQLSLEETPQISPQVPFARGSTDRDALVALFRSTGGPSWKNNACWDEDIEVSKWYGVKTNDAGRVVGLCLGNNNLQGAIPKELGELAALQRLDFSCNKLEGCIPKELGNLAALQILSLSGNQISGCIPEELGNLAALKALYLDSNQFSGCIPKELGNLAALQTLSLGGNQISGLWDEEHDSEQRATLSPDVEAGFSKGSVPSELTALIRVLEGCRSDWKGILQGNPWQHPPLPVVRAGASAVRSYFTAAFAEGASLVQRPLKVVLIGKESVGKTSLRQSLAKKEACRTQNVAEESTVHIDVEDLTILGENVRAFDCTGQEAYYASLQLFLSPSALYLLVVDMAKAVDNVEENAQNPLGELGVLRWVRSLTYRVPKAAVVLVGTKCDLVKDTPLQSSVDRLEAAAATVETRIRSSNNTWATQAAARKAAGIQSSNKPPFEICLEKGMSLVSSAESQGLRRMDDGKGWPCDVNEPGLLRRILRDPSKTKRAVSMRLPLSWQRALEFLEEYATHCRMQEGFRGIAQATLREEWRRRESIAQSEHGINSDASEGAMDGALLLRGSEGGLVVYGSVVVFDVDWLAHVLEPLLSHRRIVSDDRRTLGGNVVRSSTSLRRFENQGILEPAFAEELWGEDTAPHVLETLKNAGLTFPHAGDKDGGLVVLLRQPSKRPIHVGQRLDGFRELNKNGDGRIIVRCTFWDGVPPGFIERLLTMCCRLGTCDPFWRFGVLIQSGELSSVVILEFDEDEDTLVGKLSLEVFGDCTTADPWAVMSACLSVVIQMLSEFPGMTADAEMECQNDQHSEERGIPIELSQPEEWSSLIRDVDGCRSCLEHANDEARLRLLFVPVTDSPFDVERFRSKFGKVPTSAKIHGPGMAGNASIHNSGIGESAHGDSHASHAGSHAHHQHRRYSAYPHPSSSHHGIHPQPSHPPRNASIHGSGIGESAHGGSHASHAGSHAHHQHRRKCAYPHPSSSHHGIHPQPSDPQRRMTMQDERFAWGELEEPDPPVMTQEEQRAWDTARNAALMDRGCRLVWVKAYADASRDGWKYDGGDGNSGSGGAGSAGAAAVPWEYLREGLLQHLCGKLTIPSSRDKVVDDGPYGWIDSGGDGEGIRGGGGYGALNTPQVRQVNDEELAFVQGVLKAKQEKVRVKQKRLRKQMANRGFGVSELRSVGSSSSGAAAAEARAGSGGGGAAEREDGGGSGSSSSGSFDVVSLEAFVEFSLWWGPLMAMLSLLRNDWASTDPIRVHGFVGRLAAERQLRQKELGTFLLRFSESKQGALVVSFTEHVTQAPGRSLSAFYSSPTPSSSSSSSSFSSSRPRASTMTVKHCLVEVRKGGRCYIEVEQGSKVPYTSLHDLVRACSSMRTLYPDVPKDEAFYEVGGEAGGESSRMPTLYPDVPKTFYEVGGEAGGERKSESEIPMLVPRDMDWLSVSGPGRARGWAMW